MKPVILMMTICAMNFLISCDLARGDDALFKDVARKPPLSERTVNWLVDNDRPFAEWTLEMAKACEDHGCSI